MENSESILFVSGKPVKVPERGYSDRVLVHKGCYADTYRARRDGKYFLLKSAEGHGVEGLRVLQREYEISIGLEHPNIVSAFAMEAVDGLGLCIVMEYVQGRNLAEFLDGGPSHSARKKILFELLSAVEYLHTRDIVHNDLKPENLIVSDREGNLKLIDFGLSDDDAHYLVKTPGCTPSYASPELLSESGCLDARSDIFSLGKIIALLFPSGYRCQIRKCTRTNPERRYRNVGELRRSITRCRPFSFALVLLVLLAVAAVFVFSREEPSPVVPQSPDTVRQEQVLQRLDSLFDAYSSKVEQEPYNIFGYSDITSFLLEYKSIRQEELSRIPDDSARCAFDYRCEQMNDEMLSALYKLAGSLPTMEGLSYEEMVFYQDLVANGLPYCKYKP